MKAHVFERPVRNLPADPDRAFLFERDPCLIAVNASILPIIGHRRT